jgi:hypothetical protein
MAMSALLATPGAEAEQKGFVPILVADGDGTASQATAAKKEPTPAEKMQARFPQPTMAGQLVGLPVLDGDDSTIGYVQQVVRYPDGSIKLIVPYAKRFGWARNGSFFDSGRRPVAVPIETVAILALQIDVLDMDRDAFEKAPTWSPGEAQPVPMGEIIKIAVQRR